MAAANGSQEKIVVEMQEFLRRYCQDRINTLAQKYPKEQRTLYIDWTDVFQWNMEVADDILQNPEPIREYFEDALRTYDLPADITLDEARVRFTDLPEEEVFGPEELRSEHIGRFVGVKGQVAKRTQVKPALVEAKFVCQRCGTPTWIPQTGNDYQQPNECPGCERQGPFQIDYEESEFVDRQLVRVQQPPEEAAGGQTSSIDIELRGDACNSVETGDRATIHGIFTVSEPEDGISFETRVDADSSTVEETDFEEIEIDDDLREKIHELANGEHGDPYELLKQSIAPKHRGDEDIKLSIALQFFSGTRVQYEDGSNDRGDFHILLLGDPGTGKSTLLRAAENLAPRSAYASGKGASAAGLTASVVPDDFGGEKWTLEAGALVLANKGVACIDEIDKVNEEVVSSLHDALESQVVNINKAGINTSLPAQTSLLAAGNPKHGRFDSREPVSEQIEMDSTLMSRFDLMFMLSDEPDPVEDEAIAKHMVKSRSLGIQKQRSGKSSTDEEVGPAVDRETLRAWVAYARKTTSPAIEDIEDSGGKLVEFFTDFRLSADEDNPVPVTKRFIEAAQRLAEASAKVRLSDTVEDQDIKRACQLLQKSMKQVGIDPETGEFDADIVETGTSKAQRDRIKQVKAIISDLAGDDPVALDEIVEATDLSEKKVEQQIETLRKKGEVYEPRTDYYLVP